jgi:hypothetical protein
MNAGDLVRLVLGTLQGVGASTVFVLALFIGFCIVVGFTKLQRTAGGSAPVIKSLEERVSHRPFDYLPPTAPWGPADQLRSPELLEAAAAAARRA